jgi:hypothetical protein
MLDDIQKIWDEDNARDDARGKYSIEHWADLIGSRGANRRQSNLRLCSAPPRPSSTRMSRYGYRAERARVELTG